MSRPETKRMAWALLTAAIAVVALAACGSSGGDSTQAQSLLRQAFKTHPINSGNLTVALAVAPSASQTFKNPIELNFGGPFQSLGNDKAPKSDFTLRLTAFGRTGSLGGHLDRDEGLRDAPGHQLPVARGDLPPVRI